MVKKHVRGSVVHFFVPAAYLAVGWYVGAKYDAPDTLIETIDGVVINARAAASSLLGKSTDYIAGTTEDLLRDAADEIAAARALAPEQAPIVEASSASLAAAAPVSGDLVLCATRISNAPKADSTGRISRAGATVSVEGVDLLLMPATRSCLSSGFGARGESRHDGVDYYSDQDGDALAAGDGVVVEAATRADYGNMLVIDHGQGVYTRYAHLRRFEPGMHQGVRVRRGDILGPIGKTGAAGAPHLHFEVLTGDYGTKAKSFGLEPLDPFSRT